MRKQLRRGQVMKCFAALPPCLIGMGACATAHYWARQLTRLGTRAGRPTDAARPLRLGEQAEVADAMQAFGQDVHEEAANELVQ